MSEQWKSVNRYWCKQCKTFIRDTRFERTQHDSSPKHLSNMARFIREIAKKNDTAEKESSRAKSEVQRLRNIVSGGSSSANKNPSSTNTNTQPTKRTAVAPEKPTARPATAADRKAQMAQLAEMGIAIPDDFRRDMAIAGEWQTVSQKVIKTSPSGEETAFGTHKRKQPDHDHETDREYKGWGTKIKTYPSEQVDDDGELDALIASTTGKKVKTTKVKIEEPKTEPASFEEKDGEVKQEVKQEEPTVSIKQEETDLPVPLGDEDAGAEDTAPSIVFKKRKAKVIRK